MATETSAQPAHVAVDDTILQLRGITKVFPGVKALEDVDLDVRRGEVHALLGENGAGKSTLMKVLAGKYQAESGEILLQGKVVHLGGPLVAKVKGILLIHQELSLVPGLSVAENIFLGSLPTKWMRRIDWRKLRDDAASILAKLNCSFGPNEKLGNLSIANQQMVEIARALAFEPQIVIFDEPTSSLTDQEKSVLFENIRRLQQQGVAIIYISHRMDEIFELSDRITVLRDGRHRGTVFTSETNENEVTRLMIGRHLDEYFEPSERNHGEIALKVEKLTVPDLFTDVSFTIHRGEVLGFYGLIGAGRSEVAETIFGLRRPSSGSMEFFGEPVEIGSPSDAVSRGMGFVPEDRKEQGLVLGMGVRENLSLAQIDDISNSLFIDGSKEQELYRTYQEKLEIKTPGPQERVVNLSGGNQQKIVIAKWLSREPRLLILDEPTRGIDVGSKSEIHKLIAELANRGMAVLVISSEMPEVMGVSHRICTMYEGRITGEFDGDTVTEDELIGASIGKSSASTEAAKTVVAAPRAGS